ncbi:hypothetical protein [Amycolatopsis sp. FDAARGOS 1241]|uniref:hypothetical protein n=1 Tax=Amycolatopsis sp. FDAARGOS 1241 TaxID=2778070 RepID=UPI00194EB8E2|nr:hypothetical protein [Amycolatopsis sp. FDAARGOS 1241]QRP42807.1 hypothetical protein I6J71_25405 [Amycolatopsis sp. FDAARGOS 1241]
MISAAQVVGVDPAEALKRAGIDPGQHVPKGSERPTVSQARLLEYFARLDERQRGALLDLNESMLPTEGGDGSTLDHIGRNASP